jgi:hypothetical protein
MKIRVSIDGGSYKEMTIKEIIKEGLNVSVNRDNGYSHFWTEVLPFDKKHIYISFNVTDGKKHKYLDCTRKSIGRVQGSSVVSFS